MESNIASYHNYHVTQTGEVYRIGKDKPLYQGLAGRDNKIKYRIVTLVNKDGPRKFKVHRLVALAYIPNPNNKPCVCHKDNNPLNNRVSNLYWGTQKENQQQMSIDGHSIKGKKLWEGRKHPIKGNTGTKSPNHKLTMNKVRNIRKLHLEGYTSKYFTERFGISKSSVSKIINNRQWPEE